MAKEFAKTFYNSKRWIKCRQTYIKARIGIDGGLCEMCRDNTGYIVHHNILLTKENIQEYDISLNHAHLKYVCKKCHDLFDGHGVGSKVKPCCVFDSDGQPVSIRDIDSPR